MPVKVLVVDDSKTVRVVLCKILSALGFESIQASDGVEGLAAMHRAPSPFGLVLADWNMPQMNGLEFLKNLRARPGFASVPFIMVTTETEIDHTVEALSAGANEYLMKPFTSEMLEAKLRILQVHSS
jgi:two-component system chemotaxis response regulator CheY